MEAPLSWLKEYVNIENYDEKRFAEDLTSIGTTVESVAHIGENISGVAVGKVEAIEPHPNADKLVITKIDVGTEKGGVIQIVTGAKNLYVGAFVPVALHGAELADGVKIKRGKLRGEASDGMMCSVEELGFTRNDYPEAPEDGIYIFPAERENELTLGMDAKIALEVDQTVFDFDITSNRPDCQSIIGLAREISARYDTPVLYPNTTPKETAGGAASDFISVEIKNEDLCPRYIARVVKNVKIEPSPQWLRRRLSSCGVRPINNIVDITNYVMLEFGQPMHAFDIDGITNRKIIVRNALDGEKITTLDGNERVLHPETLVIADTERAVAVAGVMGGENSKISGQASAVLLESANFYGTNIRLTSKRLGLRTDASGRYERGLDPNLALIAINRAAVLIEQLGAGEIVQGVVDVYPKVRAKREISYSPDRINALLGTAITPDEMRDYLRRVHIPAESNTAVIPTWRADMTQEADVAEEVARVFGYGNIPVAGFAIKGAAGSLPPALAFEKRLKNTLVSLGYYEMLSYAFESERAFDKLNVPENHSLRNAIQIANPLSEDYRIMRTQTVNSLLSSLALNFSRRNEEAALFEISKAYLPKSLPLRELPEERKYLTFGFYNRGDFYDIKGAVEEILESLGEKAVFTPTDKVFCLHPTRGAAITVNGANVGFVGEVHPDVAENYGVSARIYVAALAVAPLFDNLSSPKYKPLPKFPEVKRDIALLADDSILSAQVEDAIWAKGGKILESVRLFDVFKGKNTPDGKKSMAYNLVFRASDRTLNDEEVTETLNGVLNNVKDKTGAIIRDK